MAYAPRGADGNMRRIILGVAAVALLSPTPLRAQPATEPTAADWNNRGLAFDQQNQEAQAVDAFNHALEIYQRANDVPNVATVLNNIGVAHARGGHLQEALLPFRQALDIRHRRGEKLAEAHILVSLAAVRHELDDLTSAVTLDADALTLCRAVPDPECEQRASGHLVEYADSLASRAQKDAENGRQQPALDGYAAVSRARHLLSDALGEARALLGMGGVYSRLADVPRAIDCYEQGLALVAGGKDKKLEAQLLRSEGATYDFAGDFKTAFAMDMRAQALFFELDNKRGVAEVALDIANAATTTGLPQVALDNMLAALPLTDGSPHLHSNFMESIGAAYLNLRDFTNARKYLSSALGEYRSLNDREGQALALVHTGVVDREQQQFASACARFKEAIAIVDGLRSEVWSPEARAGFLASVGDYFELYVDALMQLARTQPASGADRTALEAVEAQHARSLLDLLADAKTDTRQGIDPALLSDERRAMDELSALARRKATLLDAEGDAAARVALEGDIRQQLAIKDAIGARIRAANPKYAQLKQASPLGVPDIQKLLDPETVLVEYSLGINGSYAWAITRDTVHHVSLQTREPSRR
jgi:tetratricopeptide (TPR) repeat protein